MTRIIRALHSWLLPLNMPEDIREQARSKLLVATVLAHIAITTVMIGIFYTLVESPNPAATRVRVLSAVFTMLCYAAVLAFYRATGRRRIAVNFMVGAIYLVVVGVTFATGGVRGPLPMLFLFVPGMATLLADRPSGLAWAAITIVTIGTFAVLDASGIELASVSPPTNLARAGEVVLMLIFLLVVGALQIYDYMADELAQQLQVERNRYAYLAGHDPLTGLPNRVTFAAQLSRAVARTRRLGLPFALLYLDLDDFKPVNDRLGHQAGDEVLRTVGERLREITRENDTAARIGGDEFAMLLEGVDDPDVVDAIATKLVDLVARPIRIDDRTVCVTASVGAVLHPETPGDAQTLERLADEAMYRAKSEGGIHVVHTHLPSRL